MILEPKLYSIKTSMVMIIKKKIYILYIFKKKILFFCNSKKIIKPNNIKTNLKKDMYLKNEFSNSMLWKGKIKNIKLKKKNKILLLKKLKFISFLKLNSA